MAGWPHGCSEHELGQTIGDGEGQRGWHYCSLWGQKELDNTERLNNNKRNIKPKPEKIHYDLARKKRMPRKSKV